MTPPTRWVASAITTNSYQLGSWIDTTSPRPDPPVTRAKGEQADVALELGIAVDGLAVTVDDGRGAPGLPRPPLRGGPERVVESHRPSRR